MDLQKLISEIKEKKYPKTDITPLLDELNSLKETIYTMQDAQSFSKLNEVLLEISKQTSSDINSKTLKALLKLILEVKQQANNWYLYGGGLTTDDGDKRYLMINGGNTPSTDISWAFNKITSLGTPVAYFDGANKGYVDDAVAVENIWDRALTVISPHTAGDSLNMGTGDITGENLIANNTLYLGVGAGITWDSGGATESWVQQFGNGTWGWAGSGGIAGILDFSSIATSNKTFTFPNVSGTLAYSVSGTYAGIDTYINQAVKTTSAPTFANITDSGLTSGRVVCAGTVGILTDFSTLTYASATGLHIGPHAELEPVVQTAVGNGTRLTWKRASDSWTPAVIEQLYTSGAVGFEGEMVFLTNSGSNATSIVERMRLTSNAILRTSNLYVSLSRTDLAHGMTSLLPTDVGFRMYVVDSKGGLIWQAASSDNTRYGFQIDGIVGGAANPTASAVRIRGGKANGTTWQAMAAGETVFEIQNYTTNALSLMGDGKLGISTTAPDKQLEINHATGECLRLTYNDSNGSATTKTDFDLDSSGQLTITSPTGKTPYISPVVYDDLQFPTGSGKVPASNAPHWQTLTTNTMSYAFIVDDYIDLQCTELPHWWKQGTNGDFHIHLTTHTLQNSGGNQYAKFSVWVAYVDTNETWVEQAVMTQEITIPNGTAALTNLYLDMGDATFTNYLIGAQVKVRVKRIAATSGNEYGTGLADGDIYITQVGCHLQKDTLGSRAETVK